MENSQSGGKEQHYSKKVVALDVGGTSISAGVIGIDKSIYPIEPLIFPIQQAGTRARILNTLVNAANSVKSSVEKLNGIGIAMPGPFDYEKGISLMRHKFERLYAQDVKKFLQERIGLPVYFINDAEAFALGAWWTSKPSVPRLFAITLGTGVGACFLVNGTALRSGSEVPEGGEIWNTPWKGRILEDFISRRTIEELYRQKRKIDPTLPAHDNVKDIAQAARRGNKEAQQVFRVFAENIGHSLASHVVSFHPEIIILGGQISKAFDLFGEHASEVLRIQTNFDIPMIQTPLGDATAVVGAGYHCLKRLGLL